MRGTVVLQRQGAKFGKFLATVQGNIGLFIQRILTCITTVHCQKWLTNMSVVPSLVMHSN